MMDQVEMGKWLEERDKALRDLDLRYVRNSNPQLMDRPDDFILMVAHKARCMIASMSIHHIEESRAWLLDNGYSLPDE
jgi:hypothetical protein